MAFFLAGRCNVMVTTPNDRLTSMVSTNSDDTDDMGFNPHRKRVARTSDYLFVAAAMVMVVGVVLWAVFG